MASNFSSCLKPSAVQSFLGVSIFYLAPFFFFFFVGSESLGTYCIQPSSTLALLASILQQIPVEYFCSSIVLWSSFSILYYVPHLLSQLCFCQVQLTHYCSIQSLIISKIHLNTEQACTFGRFLPHQLHTNCYRSFRKFLKRADMKVTPIRKPL